MEYLKEWLKTITYLSIILMIVEGIVKDTVCEKYIHLFSGFLFVLCLIRPLVSLTGTNSYMIKSYIENEYNINKKLMEDSPDYAVVESSLQQEYEKGIKEQIYDLASNCGCTVDSIDITWKANKNEIKKIDISGCLQNGKEKDAAIKQLKEQIKEVYNLNFTNINIEMQG